jgi:hypothetical protein
MPRSRWTSRGVLISGARIKGAFDLELASISFPLVIANSVFEDWVNLRHTHLVFLGLAGTHVPGLYLNGADVERGVFLDNGFQSKTDVNLVGAKIGGDLDCTGGNFATTADQPALSAERAKHLCRQESE